MAEELGISVGKVSFDFSKMAARKDEVVEKVRNSLTSLIASNQITLFEGHGRFLSPTSVQVEGETSAIIEADNIIVATGFEAQIYCRLPIRW